MIKKIRQNKTWIEADNPYINLIPDRYNALDPAIVYVSNDVTIAAQRTLLRARVNRTEIVLKSTDWRLYITLFLHA